MSDTPGQAEQRRALHLRYLRGLVRNADGQFVSVNVEVLRETLAELGRLSRVQEGLLRMYADELTKEACDTCPNCGELVMCSFHSVLSVLAGHTALTPAPASQPEEAR